MHAYAPKTLIYDVPAYPDPTGVTPVESTSTGLRILSSPHRAYIHVEDSHESYFAIVYNWKPAKRLQRFCTCTDCTVGSYPEAFSGFHEPNESTDFKHIQNL